MKTDKVEEEQAECVPLAAETHLTQAPATPKGEESEYNAVKQHHHSILNNRTTRLTIYILILMIFVFPALITECYTYLQIGIIQIFVDWIQTNNVSQKQKVRKLFISAYSIILTMNVTTAIFLWDLIPGIKLSEYINIKQEDLLHTIIKSIIGFLYIIGGILIFVAVVILSIIYSDQEEYCVPCFFWATYFYIIIGSAYLGVDIMIDTFSKTQNRLIAYSFMICLCSALSVPAISGVRDEIHTDISMVSDFAILTVSLTGGIILTIGSFFILAISTRICGKLFYISRICGFIIGIGTIFSIYFTLYVFYDALHLWLQFMVIILLYCFVLVYDTQFIIHLSDYKKPETEVENAEHDELDKISEIDLKKTKSPMDEHSTRMSVYLSIVVTYSLSNIIYYGIVITYSIFGDNYAENILISGYAFCFVSCFPLIYVYFNLFSENIRNIINIICSILLLIGVILLFVGNGMSIDDASNIPGRLLPSATLMWGCVLFLLIPSVFVAVDTMLPFIGNDIVCRICAYSITYIVAPIMLLVESFKEEYSSINFDRNDNDWIGMIGHELVQCAQAGLIICVICAGLSVTVSIISKYISVPIGLLRSISLIFGIGILLSIPWFWNGSSLYVSHLFILNLFRNLAIFCYITFAGLNCLELVYLTQN